jgi:hypothetical protein
MIGSILLIIGTIWNIIERLEVNVPVKLTNMVSSPIDILLFSTKTADMTTAKEVIKI